jgi:hypothetical protein
MNPRLLSLALLALSLAGCASRATMDARYDASLQRWKGATRAELAASWGKPLLDTAFAGVETLTYVVRDDIVDPATLPTYSNNAAGAPTVGVATGAPAVPMRCTTRFELRNGVVTSWTFEGLSCGAPN